MSSLSPTRRTATRRKCSIPHCRKPARKGRRICEKHTKQHWRKSHPEHNAYLNLKSSAKKRGIYFKLTLEEFLKFAARYDYTNNKGTASQSLTIDRRDPHLGYELSNLRVITNAANIAKGNRERRDYYVHIKIHGKPKPDPSDPF